MLAPATGAARAAAKTGRQPIKTPALKPSEIVISRTGLFYCASFPRRPGLPTSRVQPLITLLFSQIPPSQSCFIFKSPLTLLLTHTCLSLALSAHGVHLWSARGWAGPPLVAFLQRRKAASLLPSEVSSFLKLSACLSWRRHPQRAAQPEVRTARPVRGHLPSAGQGPPPAAPRLRRPATQAADAAAQAAPPHPGRPAAPAGRAEGHAWCCTPLKTIKSVAFTGLSCHRDSILNVRSVSSVTGIPLGIKLCVSLSGVCRPGQEVPLQHPAELPLPAAAAPEARACRPRPRSACGGPEDPAMQKVCKDSQLPPSYLHGPKGQDCVLLPFKADAACA